MQGDNNASFRMTATISWTFHLKWVKSMVSPPIYGRGRASYNIIGGELGVRALVERFYDLMETTQDYQTLFSLHPHDIVTTKVELSRFLIAWMGGARSYHLVYGPINIPTAHAHLNVTQALVDNWLSCMYEALTQLGYSLEFSTYLINQLAITAERIRCASQYRRLATKD